MTSKDKPAFRRIEQRMTQGKWFGYAGDQLRATFLFESDAIEWRTNDPLNKGTIDEAEDDEEFHDADDDLDTLHSR
ncbi:hypothetical protein D3C81_1763820 [compost metagenome]